MDAGSPFFSVIVLAWRVEKYIYDCLKSIQNQTFAGFEAILVVPNGNDRTADICAEFASKDERFSILNIENRGQLINRVMGFSRARGEYLLCADGDDLMKPELLETVRTGIERFPMDMVIFGYECFGEITSESRVCDTFPHESLFTGKEKEAVLEKYIRGAQITTNWDMAMRRTIFQKTDIDLSLFETIRSSEDLIYNCYLTTTAESVLYLAKPLYRYRLHNSSIRHVFREGEIKDYFLARTHIRKFMSIWNMEDTRYCESLYRSIASFTTDWIYRCAMSDLPFSRKRALYRWLREEAPFYKESFPYWKQVPMKSRHRIFVYLFKRSEILLEAYARGYRSCRNVVRQLRRK